MKFTERKEFVYDMALFGLANVKTALRIYAEYIRKGSARPLPVFLETSHSEAETDDLWHAPRGGRVLIERRLEIPALNIHDKPDWKKTMLGIKNVRNDKFLISHNALKDADYFPQRGDRIVWNGYRHLILKVAIPPEAIWGQTNVWMGLQVETEIAPDGDVKPGVDPGVVVPAEVSAIKQGF